MHLPKPLVQKEQMSSFYIAAADFYSHPKKKLQDERESESKVFSPKFPSRILTLHRPLPTRTKSTLFIEKNCRGDLLEGVNRLQAYYSITKRDKMMDTSQTI